MRKELESHPVKNLRALFAGLKVQVTGYSKMKKAELVDKLLELDKKGFPVPKVGMYIPPERKKRKAKAKKTPFTVKGKGKEKINVSVSELSKALKEGKSAQQILTKFSN